MRLFYEGLKKKQFLTFNVIYAKVIFVMHGQETKKTASPKKLK
jgi:hypothetical protein